MDNGRAREESQITADILRASQKKKPRIQGDVVSKGTSRSVQQENKRKEVDFRATHSLLIAFFTLIILLHALGIYLFTSGFLLTRLVLDHKSDCAVPPIYSHNGYETGSFSKGCWHPKTVDKTIVLIIDALRYDFTVPYEANADHPTPRHFHDGIPFLYDTAVAQPNNAVLLPFIADPPTTTLQRLKGLTTGTLPTFIDAGSNFAGTAIDEDNVIAQLLKAGRNVVHLGDDTWHSLFPGYFDANLTRAYDSFNVWDLHTVDNGVAEHLLPLMQPGNSSKWDVLFGHFLGVDHAGHRYGPDHPAMKAKLQQMDVLLRKVVDLLDAQTLLVVMGDHGMDAKGDHGGESSDEVEAALWMYSKTPMFGRTSKDSLKPPPTAKVRPVNQIDLVPTLSLLLGLPIPFNNLGAPIEEAFIGAKSNAWDNLAVVNRLTAAQIHRYQDEYALVRKPDPASIAVPLQRWSAALQTWDANISSGSKLGLDVWRELSLTFASYQASNLNACKALWARFDPISMIQGISILVATLGILIVFARSIKGDITGFGPILFTRGLVGLAIGSALGATLGLVFPSMGLLKTSLFAAAFASCTSMGLQFWMFSDRLASILPTSIWSWTCVISTLLVSAGFGSNSYTIWEDEILMFMLAVFVSIMLAAIFRLPSSTDRKVGCYHAILIMIALRLTSLSRLCRDEQMPYCRTTFYASAASSTSAPWQLVVSWLIAIILPSTIKQYYQLTQSYHGSVPFWVGIAFRASLFLIAVFWTLEVADDGGWAPNVDASLFKTVRMYIAQFVCALAVAAGGATFTYQAPCIGIESIDVPVADQSGTVKRQSVAEEAGTATKPTSQLVIHGTDNLYGSHYAVLPISVILVPLLLVSKPMGQAALALTTLAILSLLELLSLLQKVPRSQSRSNATGPATSTTDASENMRDRLMASRPPSSSVETITTVLAPTILALLAHFTFFKTGHQAALASIQWDAAFIPLREIRYPWSPILVMLNTLSGQILCAAVVPAAVLWRRPHRFTSGATSTAGFTLIAPSGKMSSADRDRHAEARRAARLHLLSLVARALAVHIIVYATLNLATTVFAAHLRRHLMLYRVFSPRWMLSVIMMVMAEIVGVWIGLVGVGRTISAVNTAFGW